MAGFNAAEVVEALDFDFTAFNGPKGTIPEPSNKQVKIFFNRMRDTALATRRDAATLDEDELLSDEDAANLALAAFDETSEKHNQDVVNAVVMVCSNIFSYEDLDNLPFRVQNAFMAWLVVQIRPEEATPAGR